MHAAPLLHKPVALVVFLENVGHIAGLTLPNWVMQVIDYVTEEYAKLLLRVLGAYRRYDKVVILEDEDANGIALTNALLTTSQTHQVDVLLLAHGYIKQLVGFRNQTRVGDETFAPLCDVYCQDNSLLDLRMVFGINCYGYSLTDTWRRLGATVVNGSIGVNWFPEPTLSVFLFHWLRGLSYSEAVWRSNHAANRFWRHIWKPQRDGTPHEYLTSSRQVVVGGSDITIFS
ncbi:MAG: hypothetical protein KDE53_11250 [Caldilineaceae bacterium]|nr:hypothetical protein [Caldilineaceae bacterium]MCB0127371.1 hypothetical protein [Caldilineaceae bacterium]